VQVPLGLGWPVSSGLGRSFIDKRHLVTGWLLTNAEIQALREQRLEKWLSGDAEADVVPGYSPVEVMDTDGNRGTALILCTGYSFSGLSERIEEIFDARAAAMAYLEENGSTWEGLK
jgi:hypothetical protein